MWLRDDASTAAYPQAIAANLHIEDVMHVAMIEDYAAGFNQLPLNSFQYQNRRVSIC